MKIEITDEEIVNKFVGIKSSAKSRDIEFNLSLKKIKNLLETETCFFSNVPFDDLNKRTFDRVDNCQGYIDSNVVACTEKVNALKRNLSIEEIELLYNGIQKHKKNLEQEVKKQKEQWKPISEFEGKYSISNKGNVKNSTGGLLSVNKDIVRILGKRFSVTTLINQYFNPNSPVVKRKRLFAKKIAVEPIIITNPIEGIGIRDTKTKKEWMVHQELSLTYLGHCVKNGVVNMLELERVKKTANIENLGKKTFNKKI